MENSHTRDGVHDGSRSEANKYTQDELRLMKTQDIAYLTLKAQSEAKVRMSFVLAMSDCQKACT